MKKLAIQLSGGRTFQTESRASYKGPWLESGFGTFKMYKEANVTGEN